MRAYVFTDPALTEHAGRFVWLALDNEKAKNAPVSKRLGVRALPTFFVIDPATEEVALRWVGGATVAQLDRMLDDGGASFGRAGEPPAAADGNGVAEADRALARAERLYGAGNYPAAAAAYGAALRASPAGWPPYSRAVESRLYALTSSDSAEAAVQLSLDAFPRLRRTHSAANVAASGLDAALSLPADHPGRAERVKALEANAREVVADTKLAVAADDRSGVYGTLVDGRKDANDAAGAREVAAQWAAFLEGEAARAKTPEQRAVFDSHRLAAYMEMGEPERAIPMLEQSRHDFPDDYNPPARLAVAYQAMKRWEEAMSYSGQALSKVYGPRRLRVLRTLADVHAAAGDTAAARGTLEEAITVAQGLPPEQRSEATLASLKKKLEGLK